MAKDFIGEETKLDRLKNVAEKFVIGSTKLNNSHASTFDWLVSRMHAINFAVFEAKSTGYSDEQIFEILQEVRQIQAQSPFVDRLQNWYHGYQGDFETVEYLMNSVNQAEQNTLGYWIERYCLNTGIAQQHRNKVGFQSHRILQAIIDGIHNGYSSQILSLACGSSPDLRTILDFIAPLEFEVYLNDSDSDALNFSENELNPIADRLHFIQGNAVRGVKKFAEFGKYNLVIAGGLFDYLNDEFAIFLVKNIYEKLLADGGKFVFTNIAKPNPYKYWMEYCANWKLIERDDEDIFRILESGGFDSELVLIRKDATGLTHLVEVSK